MATSAVAPAPAEREKDLQLLPSTTSGTGSIESAAFQYAQLQSERLRIFAVLGFAAVFLVVTIVRVFLIRTSSRTTPWLWDLVLASALITYELWMLRTTNDALKRHGSFPKVFWVLSTILESSIPAFGIAFLTSEDIDVVYRPLANPAVLVFFIFIILSTLRLKSAICVFAGTAASVSYLCAALYLGWRPPVFGMPAPATQTNVSINAIVLVTGGIVAGAVAAQVRKHVEAALREAEAQRKLECLQHDLQVARSIQRSLLPKEKPNLHGFEVAGWNQPANDTGGDYFDWETLPDGKLVVSLADVTGHGIGPALLAAVCHAYARFSFRVAHTLPDALEHINQALSSDLGPGRFVTFVAARCGPGNSEVEILSAGHGPLFIYSRTNDQISKIDAQAVPLGILPFLRPDPPKQLDLHQGDVVLLVTDGFFEWENDQGEQFGLQRVEEVIRLSRDLGAQDIIAKLYEAVAKFSNGTPQQDDLTAVIIKRL